jgi:molecular chaperone GrpE
VNDERDDRVTAGEDAAAGTGAEIGSAEGGTRVESAPAAVPARPPDEDPAVLRERWLRAEADLQNYRRRAAREREEARRGAEEGVMLELIAALDDLERSFEHVPQAEVEAPWVLGVRMVANRLVDFLARQGVVAMEPVGQPFDPVFHEAILEVDSTEFEPGHVTQVVRRGWRRGERALRAARVLVARAPARDA